VIQGVRNQVGVHSHEKGGGTEWGFLQKYIKRKSATTKWGSKGRHPEGGSGITLERERNRKFSQKKYKRRRTEDASGEKGKG